MERQRVLQTKSAVAQKSRQTATPLKAPLHPIEEMQALYGNRAVNQQLAYQTRQLALPKFRSLSGELQLPMQGKGGQTHTVRQDKLEIGVVGEVSDIVERQACMEKAQPKAVASALSNLGHWYQLMESKKADLQVNLESKEINLLSEIETPHQTGEPEAHKYGEENLSGYSQEDVRVHTKRLKPHVVKAYASTQLNDIHVAPRLVTPKPHEESQLLQLKQVKQKHKKLMKGQPIYAEEGMDEEAQEKGDLATHKNGEGSRKEDNYGKDQARCNANRRSETGCTITPIQFYNMRWVDYGTPASRDALEYRKRHSLSPKVNIGTLYGDGKSPSTTESLQDGLHIERVLLGKVLYKAGVQPQNMQYTDDELTAFHKHWGPSRAYIYTERHPCTSCQDLLRRALDEDDVVYWTFPFQSDLSQFLKYINSTTETYRGQEKSQRFEWIDDQFARMVEINMNHIWQTIVGFVPKYTGWNSWKNRGKGWDCYAFKNWVKQIEHVIEGMGVSHEQKQDFYVTLYRSIGEDI